MARKSKAEKDADTRIERAFYARCSGVPINVMDIGKVFAAGRKAIAEGADDQKLGDTIRAFVESLSIIHTATGA